MTATRGSAAPMAADARRVVRFSATERRLHTANGIAFAVMFATGLVLYLPMLAQMISNRPVMKAIHLTAAAAWLVALALVAILGDRGALRRTRRELERFDDDDLLWLRHRGGATPQGRFNAGQKVHAVMQAALAALFTVSGTLLLLGERNTAFRLPGTIALHDVSMFVAGVLVTGHVWMAISPDKLASNEGIWRGTVPAGWAASHHPKWSPVNEPVAAHGARPSMARVAAAAMTVALGVLGLVTLVFT